MPFYLTTQPTYYLFEKGDRHYPYYAPLKDLSVYMTIYPSATVYTYKLKDCTLVVRADQPSSPERFWMLRKSNIRHKIETLPGYAKDVSIWGKRTLGTVYDSILVMPVVPRSTYLHSPNRIRVPNCFSKNFHDTNSQLFVTLYYVVTYMASHVSEVKLGNNIQIGFKGAETTFSFPVNKKNLKLVSGLIR